VVWRPTGEQPQNSGTGLTTEGTRRWLRGSETLSCAGTTTEPAAASGTRAQRAVAARSVVPMRRAFMTADAHPVPGGAGFCTPPHH
jgi:hypothetical protein